MPGKWRERKVQSNSDMWREEEVLPTGGMNCAGDTGRLPQPKRPACERPGLFLHAHISTIRKTRVKGPSALRFPHLHRLDVRSKRVGVTRKGATASRRGREETSQEEEAAAPLLAPSTGRRSCATDTPAPRTPIPPHPSPHALPRSTRPFKLPPKSNYASASSYPRTHPN